MHENEDIYFIALTPPPGIGKEIIQFKNDFAARFDSTYTLKVLPHITLLNPFKLPVTGQQKLLEWFQNMSISQQPFSITLKDFGAFRNLDKPVIYVHPVASASLLALYKDIRWSFKNAYPEITADKRDKKFQPHMTVAYRDLKPAQFKEAWKEYSVKKYSAQFEVNSFHLLQHDRKQWNIISSNSLR